MNLQDFSKELAPFFKENGYKRKSGTFYKIENNIAYCIYLERPGGLYAGYCIWPLYMPIDCRILTYGCRLESSPKKRFLPIFFGGDIIDEGRDLEAEKNEWCKCLKGICNDLIFPLYDDIGTLPKLSAFLEHGYEYTKPFLHAMRRLDYYNLSAHTYFMLHDDERMAISIQQAKYIIEDNGHQKYPWPEIYIDKTEKQIQMLQIMSQATESDRKAFIERTIQSSLTNLFGKHY